MSGPRAFTSGSQRPVGNPREISSMGAAAVAGTPHGVAEADPHAAAALVLLTSLHGLLKARGMYTAGHPQFAQLARRLATSLEPYFGYLGTDELRFVFVRDTVVVNDAPFRPDERFLDRLTFVLEATSAVSLLEISFRRGIAEFDIVGLVDRLDAAMKASTELGEYRAETVSAYSPKASDEHTELFGQIEYLSRFGALALYAEFAAVLRRWLDERGAGKAPSPAPVARAAARLVDAFRADPSAWIGLVTLRALPADLTLHLLDTAVIALAIGDQLGLDDLALHELLCATITRPLVDEVAVRVWWNVEPLEPHDAATLALRAPSPLATLVGFEAAAPVAPVVGDAYYGAVVRAHLATSIVLAATAYVDLLDPGEASSPFSPEVAAQLLLAQADVYFDPTVVSALVRALGTWPPGTVIRLNSGDAAVVVRRPDDAGPLGRPSIRLLELAPGAVHDLAARELAAYEIVGSVQRGDCQVNPLFVFLQ